MTLARTLGAESLCVLLLLACSGNTTRSDSTSTGSGPTSGGNSPTSGGGGPTSDGSDPTSGGGGPTSDGNVLTGGSGSPDCPAVEPAPYSSCSIQSIVCRYDNCVAPNYRDNVVLICSSGAWQLTGTERCTAPDECPPYVTLGDVCGWEGWQGSLGPCSGRNACGEFEAYCTDGSWQLRADEAAPDGNGGEGGADGTALSASVTTSPAPVPQCPTSPPFEGTSCCPSDFPAYCDYSTSGSSSVTATQSTASAVGGPAGTFGGPFTLLCAECTSNMVWAASNACP